ncbi:DUF397 domain-containing protein [Actinomadura graeca]|uniref:DUF397 domain-containing protein n=1 Tax=Actinomadura graeca TaxID=2750812 RepID=A0ABX8QWX1_9ACTN|nr:DUF397 domain-containing protein [Actinomadura graeca]QXJ23296.1 DUF397 domain-containing protein [Actinomadura graeca]
MIHWRKSSHSQGGGQGECVEAAALPSGQVGFRDSKNPENEHLTVGRAALVALVGRIKTGDLDL